MKRAMVVDDREENGAYLTALLRGHGYEVVSARHGAEALALARASAPDIVISDLLMPVMDGYTLLRHWKLDDGLARVPFVVYTATYTEPEDEQLARRLGADAFILKPVEPDELMSRIRSVEAREPSRPERSPAPADSSLLREYSEALVRKLEHKTIQLEEANRALQNDLVARAAVEVALRESEASFRLLAEALPQLVWVAQADGRNVFVNRRWAEHTGMSADDCLGEGWLGAFDDEDRERVADAWKRAVDEGAPYSLEARVRRAAGGSGPCLVRALPMHDGPGRVTRWFGTCTDIQELKDAEARLRRVEEQLQHAQKMEAVGRLAGGVAHDFNNILSIILTYGAILLEDTPRETRAYEWIAEIQKAGQRAVALTRQLLSFSRQHAIQPKVVVPTKIVDDMQPMLRRLLGEDVDLAFVAPPPFGRVLADVTQLEQVVMNLAVNARDAMPHGGKLALDVRNVELDDAWAAEHPGERAGSYVRLTVTDTGTGMDAATRARMFDPFFTTKGPGKGTGLGLSTVFGIVQQCGGHIGVESTLGRGTTFQIRLPRTERPGDSVAPERPAPPTVRGSETVLLVEDDDQVRHATCDVLQRNGYDVLDARNGGEAILVSEKTSRAIHLLVTDVVMPHLSGPELAERLRRSRPSMRVLYVSGYADAALGERSESDEAFLQKPIEPEPFLLKVREVLEAPR